MATAIKPPQQARSRQTLERLLGAAEELLEEADFEKVKVVEITEKAGVAAGSFYTRFAAKADLLQALYEHFLADIERTVAAAVIPLPGRAPSLAQRVGRSVRAVVELYRRRRAVARSVSLHHRLNPGAASGELEARIDAIHHQLAQFLLESRQEIRHADPGWAALFAVGLLELSCREKILFAQYPAPAATRVSDERLVHELTRCIVGYLTSESSSLDRR